MQPQLEVYWIPEPSSAAYLAAVAVGVALVKFWPVIKAAAIWFALGGLVVCLIAAAILQDLCHPAATRDGEASNN